MMSNQQQIFSRQNQRTQQRPQYKNYNDFGALNTEFNNQLQQNTKKVNYNNFKEVDKNEKFKKICEDMKFRIDSCSSIKEEVGDILYDLIESIYHDDAGKITGMILELGIDKALDMLKNNHDSLKEQIEEAHRLIHEKKINK